MAKWMHLYRTKDGTVSSDRLPSITGMAAQYLGAVRAKSTKACALHIARVWASKGRKGKHRIRYAEDGPVYVSETDGTVTRRVAERGSDGYLTGKWTCRKV